MDMPTRRTVALIVETSVIYGRQILRGISRHLRTHGRWSVFLDERELGASPPDWISRWSGDGIICRSTTPAWARIFRRRRLPVVDLNDIHGDLGLPRIASDMHAIGRMGAEHLCDRGFRRLAFCGFRDEPWSEQRCAGFQAAIRPPAACAGTFVSPWAGLRRRPWQEERDRIARWLDGLERPVGIMACNDVRGRQVLDACEHAGLRVPDDVAVVGVDNAATFCDLCNPPLSSVIPDAERIGFEAAVLLDRLMAGDAPPVRSLLVAPVRVAVRQSSDVAAVDDPLVVQAVRLIRERACLGISVSDVLRVVRCSRSVLERRFRERLGRSPQEEIREVRMRRIRQLLAETDWTLPRIAEAAGIRHAEYLSVLFRRRTGRTPGAFRREHRPGWPDPDAD